MSKKIKKEKTHYLPLNEVYSTIEETLIRFEHDLISLAEALTILKALFTYH